MPIDHFNLLAGFYERAGPFRVTKTLLRLLSLSPNSALLDIGGGTGRVAIALRSRVKNVIVLDVSNGMLRRAIGKGLATVHAPAESLPFPGGCMDRILMMDALHHVADQHQTAQELWRVLAPGGRILIIEPDIRKAYVKLIALSEKMLLMRSHFLTGEKICSLFIDPNTKIDVFFDEFNVFLSIIKDH
jgi:ubiquinone/menaquinone biosynthesis C-methylase UbiE